MGDREERERKEGGGRGREREGEGGRGRERETELGREGGRTRESNLNETHARIRTILSRWVNLHLSHMQALSCREYNEEVSGKSHASEAVCVGVLVVLVSFGNEAVCIVLAVVSCAVANPDLESVEAIAAGVFSVPDSATADLPIIF